MKIYNHSFQWCVYDYKDVLYSSNTPETRQHFVDAMRQLINKEISELKDTSRLYDAEDSHQETIRFLLESEEKRLAKLENIAANFVATGKHDRKISDYFGLSVFDREVIQL